MPISLTPECAELARVPKPELEFFDPNTLPWRAVAGEPGVWERVLAEDPATGLLTRLVRWDRGVTSPSAGPVAHAYFEEVLILSGSLHDLSLSQTFDAGHYACRPPNMIHGPWRTAEGCIMLETRYAPQPSN
jgi:ChrR Cupin-like domain